MQDIDLGRFLGYHLVIVPGVSSGSVFEYSPNIISDISQIFLSLLGWLLISNSNIPERSNRRRRKGEYRKDTGNCTVIYFSSKVKNGILISRNPLHSLSLNISQVACGFPQNLRVQIWHDIEICCHWENDNDWWWYEIDHITNMTDV